MVFVTMAALVKKTKANLILDHEEDDRLIEGYLNAAVDYAESYQHKPNGHYRELKYNMPPTTEQAVVMLASHFYESRDGSGGGLFPDRNSVNAPSQTWQTVNHLLRLEREVVL